MRITIAARLRPFSHRPGISCLIPTTNHLVEAFPALIRIKKLDGSLVKELPLDVEGPIKGFTVMQDLERGCVTIFSQAYRYHILPTLEIVEKKHPGTQLLKQQERISFGSHKKQEWERLVERGDFKELFPLWFRLGSLLEIPTQGDSSLLKACRNETKPEALLAAFNKLFLAHFGALFVPHLHDPLHLGIMESISKDLTPLHLLKAGAQLIRTLFVASTEDKVEILPKLPPELFAGRFLNVQTPLGCMDLEWSKKLARRLIFHAEHSGELVLCFQPSLKTFRLRTDPQKQGGLLRCGSPLQVEAGQVYFIDRFEK